MLMPRTYEKQFNLNRIRLIGPLCDVIDSSETKDTIDTADAHGMTALTIAALQGHLFALTILLKYEVNPDCKEQSGRSALGLGVAKLEVDIVAGLTYFQATVDSAACRRMLPIQPIPSRTEFEPFTRHLLVLALVLHRNPVKRLQSITAYQKARKAEEKGEYRTALQLISQMQQDRAQENAPYEITNRHPNGRNSFPIWSGCAASLGVSQGAKGVLLHGTLTPFGMSTCNPPNTSSTRGFRTKELCSGTGA